MSKRSKRKQQKYERPLWERLSEQWANKLKKREKREQAKAIHIEPKSPYNIKAHPTQYGGVMFRSRLEARWAAFFDLIHWKWEYEPIDLKGWTPDFRVEFQCYHSECPKSHTLLVEVKPYFDLSDFEGHPCTKYTYGEYNGLRIPADASAAFGVNPNVTEFEMSHGSGGGVYDVSFWVNADINALWNKAGTMVQYHPKEVTA